jgi:hypothetical protein
MSLKSNKLLFLFATIFIQIVAMANSDLEPSPRSYFYNGLLWPSNAIEDFDVGTRVTIAINEKAIPSPHQLNLVVTYGVPKESKIDGIWHYSLETLRDWCITADGTEALLPSTRNGTEPYPEKLTDSLFVFMKPGEFNQELLKIDMRDYAAPKGTHRYLIFFGGNQVLPSLTHQPNYMIRVSVKSHSNRIEFIYNDESGEIKFPK